MHVFALRAVPATAVAVGLVLSAASARGETVNCTPVTSVPTTIAASGVYCLTTDLDTSMTSGNAITIDIVGIRGAMSFSPDPATVPAGQKVVWHNADSTTHRIVFDDGQLDTGNIAAGGFSAPMMLRPPAGYHCSIHPEMVGRVSAVSAGQTDAGGASGSDATTNGNGSNVDGDGSAGYPY